MNVDEKTIRNLNIIRPQLESISKKGVVFIVAMVLILCAGLYALYVQISQGHIVTGMRDNVVWGLYMVNFIFFIGISYAGALISGILHLLRVPWRIPIIRMAEMITVISTMIGPAYILLCIGRLDRLPNLVLHGRIQSPIIWDVIAITTYLSGSIIFLYLAMIRDMALLRDHPVTKAKWRNPIYRFLSVRYHDTTKQRELLNMVTDLLSIVIIPLAILVHSVLAWIFGMTLRPGWHSTIFAPYFVVAAVYSGTGVLIVVMWVFRKIYHLESSITKIHFNYLGIIMIILGALYGYFTFSEYLTSWYGSIKWDMEVLFRLFSPTQYYGAFIFAVFVGVLLPIIIVTVPRFRNINTIAFAASIAVLALWVKRYLIIIPTLESPLLPIHDLRPEYVHYSPTWVEWTLTAAGIALFLLLFYIFSKFIPIMPVVTTGEEKDYSRLRKLVLDKEEKIMKKTVRKRGTVAAILILIMAGGFFETAAAQDTSAVKTVLSLEYNNRDGTKILTGKLSAKKEGKFVPVEGMRIDFSSLNGDVKKLIASEETGDKGKASIEIPEEMFQSTAPETTHEFGASFTGTGNYLGSSSSVLIKNVFMKLSFTGNDSGRQVNCRVWETGKDGLEVPVNDLKIEFYVPRTFSLLKVGEGTLSDGSATIDFPVTLPGDAAGRLKVVARIEDNDIYGNVEASGIKNWGKPLPPEIIVKRGLGDTNAPLWMVYTLIVLLSVVWFHYMYVIYTVIRIRYLGKKVNSE